MLRDDHTATSMVCGVLRRVRTIVAMLLRRVRMLAAILLSGMYVRLRLCCFSACMCDCGYVAF